ncbi:MAG: ChbG/HpnK family deacetylase [Desulfobacterales bacterium]
MLHLIVNGDDFGLSEKVNEGILQAHLSGILTSTSIMAQGAAFEHAVNIAKSTPSLDVGVHLTLVEETPLADLHLVQSMVDETGRFHHHGTEFIKQYFMGRICLQEVRCELEAQIKRVADSGISISHLDSHQHLHMLPRVLHIAVELAGKYGIPAIRFPREALRIGTIRNWKSIPRVVQMMVLGYFCKMGRNTNAVRTDRFLGFIYGGNLDKEKLKKLLLSLPPHGTYELMCHPGLEDPNTHYEHWGYKWSNELDALIDPEISNLIVSSGIKLVSYKELSEILNGKRS